jgi:hypothetical protein
MFPSPAGISLTKFSLGGNNDVIHKLFPPRKSLVSDIPAGEGTGIVNSFFTVLLIADIVITLSPLPLVISYPFFSVEQASVCLYSLTGGV